MPFQAFCRSRNVDNTPPIPQRGDPCIPALVGVASHGLCARPPFPFPSIEIKDKPVLTLRAGLSSLGGMEGLLQQGRNVLICPTMRYLPPIGYGRNTDSQIVQELILQSLNAGAEVVRVLDTPWATPERYARASGLRRVCDAFDANMLVWPTRTSEYVFCPLPGTSFSGLHIVKAALEADAIIFAPHALPDVDCSESQFMLHMLMGLVKERYGLSIAQQHEDVTGIYSLCFPQNCWS